ncbi:MAG TPA: aspartyl protease family protein [Chthonomonadaceae bacterium]|nr:aspartyl protease family protein [Chthonomonadaceae bacterium]
MRLRSAVALGCALSLGALLLPSAASSLPRFAANAPPAASKTARTPRERLRHAYALDNMAALQQRFDAHAIVTARVEILSPVRNTFRVVSYFQGENRYVRMAVGNDLDEQGYDGTRKSGWERHAGYVNDLSPADLTEARQTQAHSYRLLADLDRPGVRVAEAGLRRLPDGTRAWRIRYLPPASREPSPESVPTDFYLDPQTDRLRAIGYHDLDAHRGVVSETLLVTAAWFPATARQPFAYPRKLLIYEDGRLAQRVLNLKVDCETPIEARLFARPAETDRFSPASQLPTRVPITFIHGYCVVSVTVNGAKRPGRFLLDTGAASTSLGHPLARRLGLRLGPSVTNYSGLGNFVSRLSQVKSLRVGGAEVRDLPIDVIMDRTLDRLAQDVAERLDGILGNDFFRAFQMTLDYGAPEVAFNRPDAPAPSGVRVPCFLSGGAPALVAFIPGVPPLTMTIDTGAPTTWLPPRFVDRLPASRRASWVGFEGRPGGTRLVWLPEMTLRAAPPETPAPQNTSAAGSPPPADAQTAPAAAVTLREQIVWSLAAPRTTRRTGSLLTDEYEGLFGSDLLRYFRVTFDFRRGGLVFERLPQPALSRGDYVGVGLWPEFRRRSVVVARLWPFSPAARAGVRVGDELLEIDGKPIRALSERELGEYLWKGEEGKSVSLRLRRRRETLHPLTLDYRRLF